MGCGVGLLCELLVWFGVVVMGVDVVLENIVVVQVYVVSVGLLIDYCVGDISIVVGEWFDLVILFEVIEYVGDLGVFVVGLVGVLVDGGLMILLMFNWMLLLCLMMIIVGEGFGQILCGIYDWDKFIVFDELMVLLEMVGLKVIDMIGFVYDLVWGV